MKHTKYLLLFLVILSFGCAHSQAEEKGLSASQEKEASAGSGIKMFSVSSDELDLGSSLDRISGNFDTGTLPEEYTYKSSSHKRSDPLEGRSYEEVTR